MAIEDEQHAHPSRDIRMARRGLSLQLIGDPSVECVGITTRGEHLTVWVKFNHDWQPSKAAKYRHWCGWPVIVAGVETMIP